MKAIICDPGAKFNGLNGRIHAGFVQDLEGYDPSRGFLRWAEPTLVNTVTSDIAMPLPESGSTRGNIVYNNVLSEAELAEVIDIDENDETWFPVSDEPI